MIENCRAQYGDKFWGFWMLGGMSGGGMGFLFDPRFSKKLGLGFSKTSLKRNERYKPRCRSRWTHSFMTFR